MRNKRTQVIVAAALVALVAFALFQLLEPTPASAENGTIVRSGTIVTAEKHDLVLRDDDDDEHAFVVPSTAEITLDGMAAKMKDLKAGQFARVTADRAGESVVATLIEATTAKVRIAGE